MIHSWTKGWLKSQANAGSGDRTVLARGMEVVAGILLEKGMGMKAGKFITFFRLMPAAEVDGAVVTAKLLSL